MVLGLNNSLSQRLTEVLAEALLQIEVDEMPRLARFSSARALAAADKVPPQTGQIRSRLEDYVDESPVTEFVQGELNAILDDSFDYEPNLKGPLTLLPGFNDARGVASRLVKSLDDLPRRYTLSIKLPEGVSKFLRPLGPEFPLGKDMRITQMAGEAVKKFALTHSNTRRERRVSPRGLAAYMLGGPVQAWEDSDFCLQIDTQGFIDTYATTRPALKAIDTAQAFFGIGLALNLFENDYSYKPSPPRWHAFVHEETNGSWEAYTRFDFARDAASFVEDIVVSDLGGRLLTDSDKVGWAKHQLELIARVFSSGERAEKLRLASRWLFNSYLGDDELLRFVQTMVVLEILLGSGDERIDDISLSELLRNRCAYFIANSDSERSELLKSFGEIYKVRSQIVHRGKSRLSRSERSLLLKLRWICMRVIGAEVSLLTKKDD